MEGAHADGFVRGDPLPGPHTVPSVSVRVTWDCSAIIGSKGPGG